MRERQNPCWRKLLASTSRPFISVASLESSLSKTGTGHTFPGGRIGSAEKLGEMWANEMGLPPLSGCLSDSPPPSHHPPPQSGKKILMIAWAMRREEQPRHQVACFCSGVLCHFSLRVGGLHIEVTWWSLICYINTDLHSPQSARINFVQ